MNLGRQISVYFPGARLPRVHLQSYLFPTLDSVLFSFLSPRQFVMLLESREGKGGWGRKRAWKKNVLIISILTSTVAKVWPCSGLQLQKNPWSPPTYTRVSSVKCNLSGNKLLRSWKCPTKGVSCNFSKDFYLAEAEQICKKIAKADPWDTKFISFLPSNFTLLPQNTGTQSFPLDVLGYLLFLSVWGRCFPLTLLPRQHRN